MSRIESFRNAHAFLSNFYPAPVSLDGVVYPTVEHAYQAAKTKDSFERQKFLTGTPGQAKRLGRRVTRREDWFQVSISIMEDLVRQKFTNMAGLKHLLLETGDAELVEGNVWNDTFWGVCNGVGRNELGKILMKVRSEFRE